MIKESDVNIMVRDALMNQRRLDGIIYNLPKRSEKLIQERFKNMMDSKKAIAMSRKEMIKQKKEEEKKAETQATEPTLTFDIE